MHFRDDYQLVNHHLTLRATRAQAKMRPIPIPTPEKTSYIMEPERMIKLAYEAGDIVRKKKYK